MTHEEYLKKMKLSNRRGLILLVIALLAIACLGYSAVQWKIARNSIVQDSSGNALPFVTE